MTMTYNGVTIPIISGTFEDDVFTVTTKEEVTPPIRGEVVIETDDATYHFDSNIYADVTVTKTRTHFVVTFANKSKVDVLEEQFQAAIDELSERISALEKGAK